MSEAWEAYAKTMVAPATLWSAARINDVETILRLLEEGAEIDAPDHRGYSPLMLAAYSGAHDALDVLLARGADPNSRDSIGNSVLMGAAFKGDLAIVQKLIAAGADRTARNGHGLDAYEFAMQFGRADVAALLAS